MSHEAPPRGHHDSSPGGGFSMALLDDVVSTALDPGYVAVAERRAATGDTGRGSRRRLHIGAAIVLLVVGLGVALAVNEVRRTAPEAVAARDELVSRVQDRTDAGDALSAEVAALRRQVDSARDTELAATRRGRERSDALDTLALATGAVPITGPGVRITLDDAPTSPSAPGDDTDLGRVQDRDVQLVVNGLWAAGAEAVAVDGYRITARTAIRSAGEAILVDFRPITPPYVIEAVGDPDTLEARFVDGPGGRALDTLGSTYGIRFSVETVDRLTLPAAASLGELDTTPGGNP